MLLESTGPQREAAFERLGQRARVIALDRQSGALGRAVGAERRNDRVATYLEPLVQRSAIAGPLLRVHEEVEHALQHAPNADLGNEVIGRDCPECDNPLVVRWGRYGKFIGCSTFPTCRYTEPWLEKIGVACPECGNDLVERKTRKGRTFYGCSTYPTCEWTSWQRPLPQMCPVCGGLLLQKNGEWAQCQSCEKRVRVDSLPTIEHSEQPESTS